MIATGAERDGLTMVVQVERAGRWMNAESFAVGVRVDDGSRERVLVGVDAAPGEHVDVAASRAIGVPAELPVQTALLLPPVTAALRAWDGLTPEIGAAAVITPGPWAPIMSTVAAWYGAQPMLVGGADVSSGGVDAGTVARLAATLAGCPAVCAVELSGRADMVDLLLEALPKYARVLFAGPRGDRLTIDYYVNVHRKGLLLSSTILSSLDVFSESADGGLAARAARLLMNPARAEQCHAAAVATPGAR